MIDSALEQRRHEAERIREQYGVIVPSFVYKHPAIDPQEAAQLAIDLNIVGFDPSRGKDRYQFYAEKKGLYICRMFGVDINGAYNLSANKLTLRTPAQLIDLFPSGKNIDQVSAAEQQRREDYQAELLQLETDLLRKRGVKIPGYESLLEYCASIPESTGYLAEELSRNWGIPPYIPTPHQVLWDLQEHYSQFVQNALQVFDPLADWELYLKGEKVLASWEGWNLQNLGDEGYDYFSMTSRWGRGTRIRASRVSYSDALLTHTTNLHAANEIIELGFLQRYRVNFSAGRIVGNQDTDKIIFIFPREAIENNYLLFPYSEESIEKEIRSFEPISMDFCLAAVPASPDLFPDVQGKSTGRIVFGDRTLKRWGAHYLRTGKLWTDTEKEKIRTITKNIPISRTRYFDNFYWI